MGSTHEGRWRGALADLVRLLCATLLAAVIASALLLVRSGLLPRQHPLTFGLVFGAAFAAVYLLIGFLPAALCVSALRAGGWVWTARLLVSATPLAFLAWVGWSNPRAIHQLLAFSAPDRVRWAVLVAAGAALVGLGLAILPTTRRLVRGVLVVVVLLALGAYVTAAWPEPRPGAGLPGDGAAPPPSAAASQRFLLIALDAADWHYMDPLMARGELPNLAALKARGAWGPLKTFQPTLSPIIWTSVATGVAPERHGIRGIFADRIERVTGAVPKLKPPHRLGFPLVEIALRRQGVWGEGPVGTDIRRVPAYWNIATANGQRVTVVNWWVTWPAEPVRGEIVTDRFYFDRLAQGDGPVSTGGLMFPESLFAEVKPLVVLPRDITLEMTREYFPATPEEFARIQARDPQLHSPLLHELTYFLGAFATDRRVARHLLERYTRPQGGDALILFRFVDKMCHVALEYSELVTNHLSATPEEVERYKGVVSQAYRQADSAIGELVAAFGEGNVILMSDHGFQLEYHPHPDYLHDNAPDGAFIAAGPAFRPGRVDGISVYDILPLLFYLKGLPTADDQLGRLPRAALDPAFLETHAERRIATYGTKEDAQLAEGDATVNLEILEQLRALGYVRY